MEILDTWRRDWALAGWSYRPMARSDGRLIPVDLRPPEVRRRWLQRLFGQLSAVLGDFGYPTKVEVSTLSKGELSYAVDWRSPGGPAALMAFFEQANDIFGVIVTLNLACLGRDLEPMEIEEGATLWLNTLLTDSGDLNVAQEDPVYIRVVLNADIYAPRSHGQVQDNSLLAALNGPRLAGLLDRIERDVPAELFEIYDDQYRGMLGPRGFRAPSGAASDA
ncbi:MAG TPA: hypothetical protein VIG99_33290 [Myxococcaceae bacterium]